MRQTERSAEVLESLSGAGFSAAEVFLKEGRSRRFEIGPNGRLSYTSEEVGWAVRATTSRASLFCAGTGWPDTRMTWPDADGQPLRLPEAEPIAEWSPPADLGQALASENEALSILEGIAKVLADEVPGARLTRGLLEEGTSESWVQSSLGVESEYRSRAASLLVECTDSRESGAMVSMHFAARDPREFSPPTIVKRLANRLLLTREAAGLSHGRGEVLVASPVAAQILRSLMAVWISPSGPTLVTGLRDRAGLIASRHLSLVDDGRLTGGLLEAPVDGEGRSTGRLAVVEEGRYRQPLSDWRDQAGDPGSLPGTIRRESWSDLPALGASHLYCLPGAETSVGEILTSISRGYYLIEALSAGHFDLQRDRFRLPVCGFELLKGRATAPLGRVYLEGTVSGLLQGIQAVTRDLAFYPMGAMIGAPSWLLSGVGLRGA